MEKFLQRLERKLKKIPVVGDNLSDLPIMVSLVRSYIKKEYTDVPIGTIVSVVGALLYFFSPIDIVPDVLPVVGYLDDAAVISLTLKLIHDDMDEYREWRDKSGKKLI
jgi:uncharacterized membrane protein YkvA (DUF1232 family)